METTTETVIASEIRKGQRFHTDHGVRQVLALAYPADDRITIYSTDGGFRTVSNDATLRLA